MRYSLSTLLLVVFLAGSVMAVFIHSPDSRSPAWHEVRTVRLDNWPKEVQFADDGKTIVVISDGIYIYDRVSGSELLRLDQRPGDLNHKTTAAISKQRDAVAFYDADGCVSICSLRNLKRLIQTPKLQRYDYAMRFSEGGKWIVVPAAPYGEWIAYGLNAEKKELPIKTDHQAEAPFYLEEAELLCDNIPSGLFELKRSGSTVFSIAQNKEVFGYSQKEGYCDLDASTWTFGDFELSPDGKALFVADWLGNVAKFNVPVAATLNDDPVVLPSGTKRVWDLEAHFSNGVILTVQHSKDGEASADFTCYSMSDLKPFAHFSSNQNGSNIVRFEVDRERRRAFLRFYPRPGAKNGLDRVQVIDLKTGEILFARNDEYTIPDFDANAGVLLVNDREHYTLFVRNRAEWWEHFYRLETWLTILFGGLLLWRLVRRLRRSNG
jgi:hypothetical protein